MEVSPNWHGQSLDLQVAEAALKRGELKLAGDIASRQLTEHPEDVEALIVLAKTLMDSNQTAVALCVADRVSRLAPKDWRAWLLVGACQNSMQNDGMPALNRALEIAPNNPAVLRALAHACVINYQFDSAEEYARKSLKTEDHPQAHAALGFSMLHQRRWGEGWDHYYKCMGHQQWREVQDYGLQEYQGTGPVLVYAEQGLGDQIAYCSSTLDRQVVEVVCHPKLKNLLERSLPCRVYGDQFKKEIDWKPTAQYQISMSGFQRFTRRKPESFPKTPYLVPHPLKQFEAKALLRAISDKPKIGIAWTGGAFNSAGWASRNLSLEDYRPFFDLDADFICLEYKDRLEEIEAFERKHNKRIHDWPWRTQTEDYEDTAALVSCLDAIVCVPTTCYHLAGALGVKAFVIVHDTPYFHEGLSGDCPWWGSVELLRRTGDYIKETTERLKQCVCL